MYVICMCCFFFKQKTAYEMRISDWSSDVCSSDLPGGQLDQLKLGREVMDGIGQRTHRGFVGCDEHRPRACLCRAGGPGKIGHQPRQEPDRRTRERERTVSVGDTLEVDEAHCATGDRKSTRLNSSHQCASRMQSYA